MRYSYKKLIDMALKYDEYQASAMASLRNNRKGSDRSIEQVLQMWDAETPHFNGHGPHRYDNKSKVCTYCFRPIDWKK